MYLWLGWLIGANCACCFANRLVSSRDGGRNSVVGGSSILWLSAVAVDREIVGRDNEAELIGTAVLSEWLALLAARRLACAVEGSALDLGDVENNWLRRFDFVGYLIEIPPFSAVVEEDAGVVEELLEKVFDSRRVIASCFLLQRAVKLKNPLKSVDSAHKCYAIVSNSKNQYDYRRLELKRL